MKPPVIPLLLNPTRPIPPVDEYQSIPPPIPPPPEKYYASTEICKVSFDREPQVKPYSRPMTACKFQQRCALPRRRKHFSLLLLSLSVGQYHESWIFQPLSGLTWNKVFALLSLYYFGYEVRLFFIHLLEVKPEKSASQHITKQGIKTNSQEYKVRHSSSPPPSEPSSHSRISSLTRERKIRANPQGRRTEPSSYTTSENFRLLRAIRYNFFFFYTSCSPIILHFFH